MRKRITTAAFAIGCAAAASFTARAETFGPWTPTTAPVSQYDGTYVTLGAGAFVQNTGDFNYFTGIDGRPFFSASPDIVGGTGGITLGILLGRQRKSSWLGSKPRIEVSFSYGRGSGSATDTRAGSPLLGEPFMSSVDGSIVTAVGCGTGCSQTTSLNVNSQSLSGAIRLKSDVHLARNLYVTPALGFVAGNSSTDYEVNGVYLVGGTVGVVLNSLNENLNTTRLGGELGADVTWKISGKWTLFGGASVAVFRMGTRFIGNDCISGILVAPGSACIGTQAQTSISSYDHQTGYRVGMNTGVTYNGGWYRVSLVGHGRWDSDVPGVRNSSSNNALLTPTAPARIVYSSQWRYGGFVSVAFPF